jgi:hypothetical protein
MKRAFGFSIFLLVTHAGILSLFGCNTYNSSTGDRSRYGSTVIDTTTGAGMRLYNATQVLRARCYQCHQSQFGAFTDDTAWDASPYVTAGDPSASSLYTRLYGAGLGGPQEDMPQGGALAPTEIAAIRDWILGIGSP